MGRKNLRVEEIGKRLDDWGDYTRECNRFGLNWERSYGNYFAILKVVMFVIVKKGRRTRGARELKRDDGKFGSLPHQKPRLADWGLAAAAAGQWWGKLQPIKTDKERFLRLGVGLH